MTYDAGTSRGKYELDISAFEASIKRTIKLYDDLANKQRQVPKSLPPIPVPPTPRNPNIPNQQRLMQQLADSEIRAARAAGDHARALQLVDTQLGQASAGTVRYNNLLATKSRLEAQAARAGGGLGAALPRTFAGITAGGVGALAGLGIATAIPEMVRFGVESGKASLALDRQLKLTKELAGSQAQYNDVIKAAKRQQELYGGSLQSNVAGIQGLLVTSRSTGAELSTLINLAQRLAVLDPAQGAEGARIALSEILAGDPRSLARRYEIPLSALEKIKDESIPVAERLKILDDYLAKIGITSATVTSVVSEQARTYNNLSTALDKAKVSAGAYLSALGQKPAQIITAAINEDERKVEKQAELFDKAKGNYDAYVNGIAATNTKSANIGFSGAGGPDDIGQLNSLTQAQFAYVQSLRAQGVASDEAVAKAQGLKPVFDGIASAQERLRETSVFLPSTLTAVSDTMLRVATSGDQGRAVVDSLTLAFQSGGLTVPQLTAALSAYEAQQAAATVRTQDEEREQRRLSGALLQTSGSMSEQQKALVEHIAKSQAAAQESEKLASAQATLANLGADVFKGLITARDGAALLAQQYGITLSAAQALIVAQAQIAGTKINATALSDQRAGERDGGSGRTAAQITFETQQDRVAAQARARRAKEIADAQLQLDLANAKTNADKIAIYRRQLAGATDQAERIRLQAQIASLQNTGGGAGKGPKPTTGLTGLTRTSIELAGDERDQLAAVNAELSKANLTAQQRNQLELQRRDLVEQIADEEERAGRAAIDARIGANDDAIKRIKERREAAGLQRALDAGRLSGDQAEAARLNLERINLDQQKRAADIQKDLSAAGLAPTPEQQQAVAQSQIDAARAQQAAFPNFAQLPPAAQGQTTVNLSISIAKDGTPTVQSDPGVLLNLIANGMTFRNLSGGAAG